jgi:Spy/CpxP family protein refolding chaperone
MSSRVMQAVLALSLLLNTFVLVGFVYSSWISPPAFERHMPPPPPGTRPSPVEMLMKDLGLDDGQREAVRAPMERYAAARRERFREMQKLRDQTAAELARPQMDMTRIDGLIDQLTRLRAEQWKESLHTVALLEPQLRPDQRERLHVLLAERLAGAPPPPRAPGGPAVPGQGRPPQ